MSALLDMLKKAGAKPEDLEAMRPMLENPDYNAALLNEFKSREDAKTAAEARARDFEVKNGEYVTQLADATARANAEAAKSEEMVKWYTDTATPAYEVARNDAIKAREYAAQLDARLKAAEEYGFNVPKFDPPASVTPPVALPIVPSAPVPPIASAPVDLPDLTKFARTDDLQNYYAQAGDAIAQAQDIAFEHQQLFGLDKPITFTELRQKAATENLPIRQIWEREFNVSGRKAEIEQTRQAKIEAAQKEREDGIRKEAREQALSEIGNPMTREPQVSKHPTFAFATRDRAGKVPWGPSGLVDRSDERASRVMTTLAKQEVA